MKKLPLRKCLQCQKLKRETFRSQRCQACYDENERVLQTQVEVGEPFPLDLNLCYYPYATTFPDPHEYLWYFLTGLLARLKRAEPPQLSHEWIAARKDEIDHGKIE